MTHRSRLKGTEHYTKCNSNEVAVGFKVRKRSEANSPLNFNDNVVGELGTRGKISIFNYQPSSSLVTRHLLQTEL